MNGQIRDRENISRGLKSPKTPILKGIQRYHNFMKPHELLNGKTPAEAAGIMAKETTSVWHLYRTHRTGINREGNQPPTQHNLKLQRLKESIGMTAH